MASSTIPTLDFSSGFAGKLVVAMPHLVDTPFEKALTLICSHDEEHAFGVIVNKPMADVSVADILAEMDIEMSPVAEVMPVFFGGPVALERGAVLHADDYQEADTVAVAPGVGLTASKTALQALCSGQLDSRRAMLVMGHSGWDGGQLEDEIKRNDWLTLQGSVGRIFRSDTNSWTDALVELGISDLTQFDGNENLVARPN